MVNVDGKSVHKYTFSIILKLYGK